MKRLRSYLHGSCDMARYVARSEESSTEWRTTIFEEEQAEISSFQCCK